MSVLLRPLVQGVALAFLVRKEGPSPQGAHSLVQRLGEESLRLSSVGECLLLELQLQPAARELQSGLAGFAPLDCSVRALVLVQCPPPAA